jgi:hypothetical protein
MYNVLFGEFKREKQIGDGDTGVDGKIILKCILKKYVVKM